MNKIAELKNNISESYDKINEANKSLSKAFLELSKELKLEDIKVTRTSEYDDNNYFTVNKLHSVFDLKDMELDGYDIREGFPSVVEFLKTLQPPNSIDFMEVERTLSDYIQSKEDEIEEFTGSFDYSHTVIEVAVACIKSGIPLENLNDVGEFLADILDAPEASIPDAWSY
jgi:hypothetical protein